MIIGKDSTVTVLGVKGNQVRLGFNCPKDVDVHRSEIFKKIHGEGSLPETDAVEFIEKAETVKLEAV